MTSDPRLLHSWFGRPSVLTHYTSMALVGVRATAGVYAAAAFWGPGQQNQRQAGFVKGLTGNLVLTPAGLVVADFAACLRAANILSLQQHRYDIEVAPTAPVQGPTSHLFAPRRPRSAPLPGVPAAPLAGCPLLLDAAVAVAARPLPPATATAAAATAAEATRTPR